MATVEEWDRWFALTGDGESVRAWEAAKSVHADPEVLGGWASIIELNRLDRLAKTAAAPPVHASEGPP